MKVIFIFLLTMNFVITASYAQEVKDLTILIYQSGDDDLINSMNAELQEIARVSSNDRVNIVVFQDLGNSQSTKIYYVNNGTTVTVKDFSVNVDSGDWNTLVDYFSFAKNNFPARKYILNISSHGSGWLDKYSSNEKGIAYDSTSGNHITTFELGWALEKIKEINDAQKLWSLELYSCLMSSVEVLYEFSDSTEFVIASPFLTYSQDSRYFEKLTYLANNPSASGESYLKNTIGKEGFETNSYFVGIKMASFNELAELMKIYSLHLRELFGGNLEKILSGITALDSMAYKAIGYRRLERLLINISERVNEPLLGVLTEKILLAIDAFIIARSGSLNKGEHAVSIWLPLNNSLEAPTQRIYYRDYTDSYSQLKWEEATQWLSIIEKVNGNNPKP